MQLPRELVMGALQLSKMTSGPIYIHGINKGFPFLTEKPMPPDQAQWVVYPIGQLQFHAPVNGANEYFFTTIDRNIELDLKVLAQLKA